MPVEDRQFLSPPRTVAGESMPPWVLTWKDADQLEGSQPFELKLLPKADDAPTISVEGLPRQAVVLVTEQINFQFLAGDDFGVRRAGMEWKGVPSELVGQPASGEQVLAAGGPQQTAMQWQGVFNANDWKIEPQAVELRVWVEDYLPASTHHPTLSSCSRLTSMPSGSPNNSASGTANRSMSATAKCNCMKPTNSCAPWKVNS
jgi:hypothetical protein